LVQHHLQYVLLGASFVGVALGFFAENITEDSETWFFRLQDEKKIQDFILLGHDSWKKRARAFFYSQRSVIKAVLVWFVFVAALAIIRSIGVGWSFREAQYCAISTLSTGRHWSIPEDSPTWLYGLTAALTSIGVPVMGLAMAAVGQALMEQGDVTEAQGAIDEPITIQELQLLQDIGLEDGDGTIDMSEFILLCMMRTGTDPSLLSYIRRRFLALSHNGEFLTIEELTQHTGTIKDGILRNKQSVIREEKLSEIDLGLVSNSSDESETPDTTRGPENVEDEIDDINNHQALNAGQDEDGEVESQDTNKERFNNLDVGVDQNVPNKSTEQMLLPQHIEPKVRPLKSSDDYGMALLDREYVMTMEEEISVLNTARGQMKIMVENAENNAGWSTSAKVGQTRISSKEGVDGSPYNMIKGVTELGIAIPIDFVAAQIRYERRSPDSLSQFFLGLDPSAVQLGVVTTIRNRELLDDEAFEECGIVWTANKPPQNVVDDRDVCIIFLSRKAKCPVTGDDIVTSPFFSTHLPGVPDMELALGRVRAVITIGGYVLKQPKDASRPPTYTFIIQYDPKGKLRSDSILF